MIFNSLTFVVFLLVVLCVYYQCRHQHQNRVLLIASYVFYGWWDYRFLSLLALSTLIDFHCGRRIHQSSSPAERRRYLGLSIGVNLSILGLFKYYHFFVDSAAALLAGIGLTPDLPTLRIILPVGISFYTFQSLSYTVDIYRNVCVPTRNLFDFALYVSFFPQLVAGPIERAHHLLPQILAPRTYKATRMVDGLWLIMIGYIKKLVIADSLAPLVDTAFSGVQLPADGISNWLFLYAFAFQIYGDFSGYSDIARGVAKLLGIELMVNFRQPYLVTNPSVFWQHWHISLSSWLRDYLYIPLGGNRHGLRHTYCNLLLTMLLGGLWHGAGWAFVAWGLFHGLLLIVHRWCQPVLVQIGNLAAQVRVVHHLWHTVTIVIFFHLTCLGWLLFRAGAIPDATTQVRLIAQAVPQLVGETGNGVEGSLVQILFVLGGLSLILQWRHGAIERFHTWSLPWQVGACTAALILISTLGVFNGAQFIYFQF